MHDYYVIGMIETGTQAFWYQGAQHITPSGGVFVINPGEAHTGEAVDGNPHAYLESVRIQQAQRLLTQGISVLQYLDM